MSEEERLMEKFHKAEQEVTDVMNSFEVEIINMIQNAGTDIVRLEDVETPCLAWYNQEDAKIDYAFIYELSIRLDVCDKSELKIVMRDKEKQTFDIDFCCDTMTMRDWYVLWQAVKESIAKWEKE